jgi:hypothetical protein
MRTLCRPSRQRNSFLICNSIKSSIKSAPLIYVFYIFVRTARSILSNALALRCSAIAALARSP